MLQRETRSTTHTCPHCGARLASDRNLFRCKEHGQFFAYGPQLLVRAPRQANNTHAESLLPWEHIAHQNGA